MREPDSPHLRLYVEHSDSSEVTHNLPSFAALSRRFQELTGWTLTYRETETSRARRQGQGLLGAPIAATLAVDDLSPQLSENQRPLKRFACDALVESLNEILGELDRCREQIWQQNALLATGIPVTDGGDSAEKLAGLLQSILRAAIECVGCDAAALYILDDATRQLDLRSQFGIDSASPLERSRELSRCKGDLEALLGHAVVLEDSRNYREWMIPITCGAAVCLPVSSSHNLLGTVWFFSAAPRSFDGRETQMLEILAGRIASELERHALVQSLRQQNKSAAGMQQLPSPKLPNVRPPIDELTINGSVAAGVESARLPGAVYDWAICRRGQLAFLIGYASDLGGSPGITATILQTAFRSHSAHCRSAVDLFDAVFETMLAVNRGDEPVRFTCGYIDPAQGCCSFASTEILIGSMHRGSVELRIRGNESATGEFGIAHAGGFELQPADRATLALTLPAPMETSAGGDERARAAAGQGGSERVDGLRLANLDTNRPVTQERILVSIQIEMNSAGCSTRAESRGK
jgi:hypothetical protein